jgi:hypothetical protein
MQHHSSILKAIMLAALLAVAAPEARAEGVIFDSGVGLGDLGDAIFSDPSFFFTPTFAGDDFTIGLPAIITGFEWTGIYAPFDAPGADDFTIAIYEFSGTDPAIDPLLTFSVGDAGRTDTGVDLLGFTVYSYSATVAATSLAAGRYLLSIVNDTTGQLDAWAWASALQDQDAYFRDGVSDPWSIEANHTQDFTIRGTVIPEPSSIALAALGGLGLATAVRRQSRRRG